MDLCSIINGRGGRCSENCKFCAQSAHHHTRCDEHGFLELEELVEGCKEAEQKGVDRYSIVTAGRNYFPDGGNATITGDMLTTTGQNTAQDRSMLEKMEFKLKSKRA